MKRMLLASLEKTIEDWMDKECESDDWFYVSSFYVPDDLASLMTNAAAAVFDANVSGQKWAKENE